MQDERILPLDGWWERKNPLESINLFPLELTGIVTASLEYQMFHRWQTQNVVAHHSDVSIQRNSTHN